MQPAEVERLDLSISERRFIAVGDWLASGYPEPMPLVRVDLLRGKSPGYRADLAEVIYRAMLDVLKVPDKDKFVIITEHAADEMQFDREYLGIRRTEECVFIQITLNAGRTVEVKQSFYKKVTAGLHEQLGLRREDVFINLVEVAKENWFYGGGED
jgi:phenylpyruvate tautomerase PptA (4-oxalocrotonate tautomerase family)